MKRVKALITASVISMTALLPYALNIPDTEISAAEQVKIMPVGDSITFGFGEEGGYRKYLDNALKSKGISFDMVGPEGKNSESFMYNGQSSQYDGNHAGYSGFTIRQQYPVPSWGKNGLLEKLQEKNAVKQAQPDVVLLIIGTNDMTANRNLNDCEKDLHALIDYIISSMPEDGVIFLGSIPEFTAYGGNAQRVANYNSTVKKVAESYGDNVQFADVHGSLNGMADMGSDKLHPNGAGYEKMGKFWAGVIEKYISAQNTVPEDPDNPEILYSDFENGTGGWQARGSASVSASKEEAAEGNGSVLVSGRTADWNGIAYPLNSRRCPAGSLISVTARLKQTTGSPVHFKMTMQYDNNGTAEYDTFAEKDAASGEWVTVSAPVYTLKEGSSPVLYFETDTDLCDFYLDEVKVMKTDGTVPPEEQQPETPPSDEPQPEDPPVETPPSEEPEPAGPPAGDINGDGVFDAADLILLQKWMFGDETVQIADIKTADVSEDGVLNLADFIMLKSELVFAASH